ncbi:nitronate monooxygenase [Saccharopolyspora pogona]|uniref:nitronate monooxygenase n=1 Tax=Saccharopolyspora pogona TaxID=333966 RepID=UPI0021E079C7|nr:nitronate monooxygenase [Saccharopolyspora pogona]
MRTALTDLLGIESPLVSFNRSPGVVAAVTNAGGIGVLAATGYTPEELDAQLTWIEEQVDGRPYGVDVLVPGKTATGDPADYPASLRAQIPQEHYDFVNAQLAKYDIPPVETAPAGDRPASARRSCSPCWTSPSRTGSRWSQTRWAHRRRRCWNAARPTGCRSRR